MLSIRRAAGLGFWFAKEELPLAKGSSAGVSDPGSLCQKGPTPGRTVGIVAYCRTREYLAGVIVLVF